jgi:hypothetical protein
MDSLEFHQSVIKMQISLATQSMAKELIASFRHSRTESLMARVREGENSALFQFPIAACLDSIDLHASDVTKRPQVYRLNRGLGLSALEAARHSSPDEGYQTAIFALVAVAPE